MVVLVLVPALLADASALPRARSESVEGPRLVYLPPGASVKEGPPKGWTSRVIRSVPRLASGELSTLPESAAATATLFRTIVAVQVVARGESHELARVGIGIAVPVGGRELVVNSNGPEAALATLGFVERVVLKEAEAELAKGRLVARTANFALYRAPSLKVVEGKHETVDFYYAILVDPGTGAVTTLFWSSPAGVHEAPSEVVELPPNLTTHDALDVKVTRWLGPVPLSWSFALSSRLPGRRLPVPAPVARLIADAGAHPSALALSLMELATRR